MRIQGPPQIGINPIHCETCRGIIARYDEIADFLKRCQECGLQMDELISRNDEIKRFAEGVLRQFFTGQ